MFRRCQLTFQLGTRALCSAHNQLRALNQLQARDEGKFICHPKSRCKTPMRVTCSVHGRQRVQRYMSALPNGQWECYRNNRCTNFLAERTTTSSKNLRETCSDHKVARLSHLLVANSDGKTWRCRPEHACFPMVTCSRHPDKTRRRDLMRKMDDGTGYVCEAPNEC